MQNAGLMPAFLLSSTKLAKPASLYQNAELMKSAFLEFHLRDVMFSNARSTSFLKEKKHTSLYQNAELMKFAFLKLHLIDARSASLLKDMRPAFLCQNVRFVSLLQDARPAS